MTENCPRYLRRQRIANWMLRVAVIAMILVIVYYILQPVARVREAAPKMRSSNNLKRFVIAMHTYHDARNHLPGANAPHLDLRGGGGKHPVSWRVLLLTYLDDDGHGVPMLSYRFDEPWDGPNNIQLLTQMPKVYRHPKADSENVPAGYTHYRVFVSRAGAKPSAIFTDGMPGPKMCEITDGTSITILIVEAAEAVPWTMPEVLLYDRNQPLPKLGGLFPGGYQTVLADGSVKFFRDAMPEDKLRAWITKDGGEPVDED